MNEYDGCRLCDELPQTSVPEHMVLLSFNSDCFAEPFADWWADKGERLFIQYLRHLEG